jgi:hypothetical protein
MEKEENLWSLVKSFERLPEYGRIHLRNYLEELLFLQGLVLAESLQLPKEAIDRHSGAAGGSL